MLRRTRPTCLTLLLLVMAAGPGFAQTVLREFPGSGSDFGAALGEAGDVDADGTPDLIVGAPGQSATVYSGATGAVLAQFLASGGSSRLGVSVDGVGDLNLDGHDDVIVGDSLFDGAGTRRGRARVYSGKDQSVLYTVDGSADEDRLGISVSGTGDLDADGVPDFLVGAVEFFSGPGYFRVYSGANGALVDTLSGSTLGDAYGSAVRGSSRDVDGDGVADFFVGAPYEVSQGVGYILSGADRSPLHRIVGTSGQGFFASMGEILPDRNGDGQADFALCGTFDKDPNGDATGRVALYSGADGSLLDEWFGRSFGDLYGHSIALVGDVDGDGVDEVAIGARDASHRGGSKAGSFEIRSVDGRVLHTSDFEGDGSQGGSAVSALGDVDGDGRAEFAVGAARLFEGGNFGWAGILSGSQLVFDLRPDLVLENDSVELNLRGVPQKIYMVFLHEVSGVPFTLKLLRGTLNGAGLATLSGTIPPGAAGVDLRLSCFSVPAAGGVVESNFELLRIR